MITTPEQMREAAIVRIDALINAANKAGLDDRKEGLRDARYAIRAIPIAPQAVAVTAMVKPLVDRFNVRLDVEGNTATAMMEQCQNGYWVRIYDYEALSALTIHPADPLSDPRVVALVEALGAMPDGYCFCSKERIGDDSKVHEPECRDLRAVLGYK